MSKKTVNLPEKASTLTEEYKDILTGISELLETARRQTSRVVNSIMTATYWDVGRRIVEFEQKGESKAQYGSVLLKRLSLELISKYGRGFSERNLQLMRLFYIGWPISQTLSAKFNSEIERLEKLSDLFKMPWSSYVRLMSVENIDARAFYETEALRGGWSVRQLDRQINSMFYERTLLSKNKAAVLKKGMTAKAEDIITAEEEIKDPFVLEFLGLKDEYSENALEEALIQHLEKFLLELGGDFAFVGRQRQLRIGNEWYRIDLVFFHRKLRCLVIIDLKIGKFTHADAGQMHMYLNYAKEHWTLEEENPPVGLILCAEKNKALAHYALEGLPNKVLTSEYKLALPDEKMLVEEIKRTQAELNRRVAK